MEIPAEQLKFEVYPIPGIHQKGGQHVGMPSGVQVTHLPSGIKAYVDIGRSQHDHKKIAMEMILAAITHPKFR
ncbi:peptide chain release factor family protein [Brucella pituitosa]|uniref:peptide chain release factor family protein n=1 Tax=Brucella pituitosa TaxID=571256 RepID=UPI003F4AEF61